MSASIQTTAISGRPVMPWIPAADLDSRYSAVRGATRALTDPLEVEDYGLQSMTEASPAKWHLAHTTWFFETFVLSRHVPDYTPFHPRYGYLFNSYYETVGRMHPRPKRGLLTRPTVAEVQQYRDHIDHEMGRVLAAGSLSDEAAMVIEVGLHHEQQHQELILTDVKHGLSCNPLQPIYRPLPAPRPRSVGALSWVEHPGGLVEIGHRGESFGFDNEFPRHRTYLTPFRLATRLITCGEYLEFIADGGYRRPELWLSAGWDVVQREGWRAPLYWERESDDADAGWSSFTLGGRRPICAAEPVCHVSLYEADAFARWHGSRLPTEAEWEVSGQDAPLRGNFVEQGALHPVPLPRAADTEPTLHQAFGDVWEWTASAYAPYPGFSPLDGSLAEYNGKFMCNQLVLRGGSCATPASHARATYRNFFPPEARWQFSGIRLARDP